MDGWHPVELEDPARAVARRRGSSPNVYAIWVRVAKVRSWSKRSAPRSIWFRRNSNHGSGAWATAKRLTAADGRVDYPSIAAAGANVYIAYTNANSSGVKLLPSHDHWQDVVDQEPRLDGAQLRFGR